MTTQILYFAAYCFLGGLVLHQLLRGIHKVYSKMWINHPPQKEPLVTKIFLLWKYNSIITLAVVGISILYSILVSSIFPDLRSLTVLELSMITVLFAFLNTVFRISTYGYIKDPAPDHNKSYDVDQITALERKGVLLNTYLSFTYSLIIFVFIGLGMTIATGAGISLVPFDGVNPTRGVLYASAVTVVIFIFSILSELLLWVGPFNVPEYLSD